MQHNPPVHKASLNDSKASSCSVALAREDMDGRARLSPPSVLTPPPPPPLRLSALRNLPIFKCCIVDSSIRFINTIASLQHRIARSRSDSISILLSAQSSIKGLNSERTHLRLAINILKSLVSKFSLLRKSLLKQVNDKVNNLYV